MITSDRVLDVVWILALGYNMVWFGHTELAWAAAMFAMFGSYLGTQAQAVAGSRNYGGFSRADRMVLTLQHSWVQRLWHTWTMVHGANGTILKSIQFR